MRRAARYHPTDIGTFCQLEPSGDHRLLVETPNGIMLADYDVGQVRQLEAAIEKFNALVAQADGGQDFHNRKTIPIPPEVSR